jgi:addiction module RelB/DinJ family antitoxin
MWSPTSNNPPEGGPEADLTFPARSVSFFTQGHLGKHYRCIYNSNMKTLMNIKTDKKTKEQAQKLAHDLGLTPRTLATAQLKQAIRTKTVHLTVYTPTPRLEKILKKAERDIATLKNLSRPFDNIDEMMAWLKNPKKRYARKLS